MSDQLLRDIFDFLTEVRPEFGMPEIIILGGSQTIANGAYKTKDSDYDTLVLFPHIERPESYTFTSKNGHRVYDLILRDPATLAHDVAHALDDGKGTLLHIATLGTVIYDPEDRADQLQSNLQRIYKRGPNIIHIQDMMGEISSLHSNLFHIKDNEAFMANLLALSNRIAKVALRFAGEWTSNGKIAGRYLKEKNLDLCASIQIAFGDAVASRTTAAFSEIIHSKLPQLFYGFDPRHRTIAAPQQKPDFDTNPHDFGAAITAARINLNAMAHYLKSQNMLTFDAAVTWAYIKSGNLTKPLTEERHHKRPEEYFFALGRAIAGLADIEAALHFTNPTAMTMAEIINYLFEMTPNLDSEIEFAVMGHAQGLVSAFEHALSRINRDPRPHLYRPSPLDLRVDPAILNLQTPSCVKY